MIVKEVVRKVAYVRSGLWRSDFWMQVSLYVCLYFGADVVVCYFTLGRGAIPMFFFYCTGNYSFGGNIPGWMEVGSMEREARGGVGGSAKKNCTLSSCAGFVAVDDL